MINNAMHMNNIQEKNKCDSDSPHSKRKYRTLKKSPLPIIKS
ncbi:hypothetical protein K710_0186 [Streptococcus iniae SF1]|nr:hypothetical protein K710_0186 [Streptococcus iniae SF1]